MALTFGTLLSSQRTDAFALRPCRPSFEAVFSTVRPQASGSYRNLSASPSRAVRRAEMKLRGCQERVKRGTA